MVRPIAVSLGDPAGIGPELIAEAWARRDDERLPPFFAVGCSEVLRAAAATRGIDLPIAQIGDLAKPAAWFATALPVLRVGTAPDRPGQPDAQGARLAVKSLERAVATVGVGVADALVTGPTAKAELARIGFDFPGQTEFVASWCGVRAEDAVMMLAGLSLRTVPMTVHCALAEVPKKLSVDLIRRRCTVVARALREDFGIAAPRLAVCGLNPHAGEEGRMGREEIKIIALAKSAIRNNLGEEISQIKKPTLLIWGNNDSITPPFVGREFHKLISTSELHFVDKCGHAPMMEQPHEFNEILHKFLTKLNTPAAVA